MSKKKLNTGGLVYSTDPDFKLPDEDAEPEITLPNNKQLLRVRIDKQHRAGKIVTLITGFAGTENDIQELSKKVKSFCGTGGSVKGGEIIIQGNNADKVFQWLQKNGYTGTKKL